MTDTGSSKASSSRNAALLSFIEKELYTAVVSDALDELGARGPRLARASTAVSCRIGVCRMGENHCVR